MKILITSDIHKNLKTLVEITKKENPYNYHLDGGDSNFSKEFLDEKGVLSVKGNTDFFSSLPNERLLEIDGKKILIIHGHTLKVKRTLDLLISYAKSLKVNICIYGHTHMQSLEVVKGITFLNPGSVLDGKYAVYLNGKITLY